MSGRGIYSVPPRTPGLWFEPKTAKCTRFFHAELPPEDLFLTELPPEDSFLTELPPEDSFLTELPPEDFLLESLYFVLLFL